MGILMQCKRFEGRRALITGISGQDGSFLAEFLLQQDYEVFGLVRRTSIYSLDRLAGIEDQLTLLPGDLLDASSLLSVLERAQPHEVYNLAAQSFVPTSWSEPVACACARREREYHDDGRARAHRQSRGASHHG